MTKTMAKTCIPVIEDRGEDSRVSPHFGKAPMYLLWDGVTPCGVLRKEVCSHEKDHACLPTDALLEASVSRVVCQALGRGAMNRMLAAGIDVFITRSDRVSEVLAELESGRAVPANPAHCCEGHHHD
jgi:predicted Fe-Mo cluster-binding NifX family protein